MVLEKKSLRNQKQKLKKFVLNIEDGLLLSVNYDSRVIDEFVNQCLCTAKMF